ELPVLVGLKPAVGPGGLRLAVVDEHDAVAHERPVLDRHAFADEGVALDLAAAADPGAALDLNERPDAGLVPDLAAVEIPERLHLTMATEDSTVDHPNRSLVRGLVQHQGHTGHSSAPCAAFATGRAGRFRAVRAASVNVSANRKFRSSLFHTPWMGSVGGGFG